MKEKISKTKMLGIIQKVICAVGIMLSIIIFVVYKINIKSQITYTVINGYVEKISDSQSVILTEENVINVESGKVFYPVIEEGKRVAKDEIIATYQNIDYENYLSQISQMDSLIETLIKDLPTTYSADVSKINNQIEEITDKSANVNSYVKMQEYKSKLDKLSYKKVSALSSLSPNGSKIRELIEQREELEKKYKESGASIKTNVAGVVSYKIDGLENKVEFDKVLDYTEKEYDEIFSNYSSVLQNNLGVKIINNFEAYLLTIIPQGENDEYIKEGSKYNLKLTDMENKEISAKLVKKSQKDGNNYLVFYINNYIENFTQIRETGIEIIWDKTEGMAVFKTAIKKSEDENYDYVTLVNGGRYLPVPVNIISSSDTVCIVENFTSEQKEHFGITSNAILELYDILVIER